jgi:alpha-glucosidase/alpha-D-xyloside xylohydrolase
MLRLSLLPVDADANRGGLAGGPELVVDMAESQLLLTTRATADLGTVAWGEHAIELSTDPLEMRVIDRSGHNRQTVRVSSEGIAFALGTAPLFGLGQGGQQFDRRGGLFARINGQGEGVHAIDMNAPGARAPAQTFDLAAEGARITIPWIVSAEGWAIYVHRPEGTFDLTGDTGRLIADGLALPLDLFLIVSDNPCEIMRHYALLTGFSHLPPLWSLGYLQSHRTLASRDEVLAEARTFRERRLPCDGMIYLGTGFCPDGWNTGHGAFAFNPRIFPDPEAMVRQLHAEHMKIVVHVVDPPLELHGTIGDGAATDDPAHVSSYWARHKPARDVGIDGWWPDVGDRLSPAARLARIRMYHDGPLATAPDRRPFALHRNAYAGVQRYGWVWSGDVDSAWRTLAMQVPVGLNCGLSGIALWGTDTGGFITTRELTGELYVRWFQYSCFCPLFRSHGRTWKLRLPWAWNSGEFGPEEYDFRRVALPDASELHNPAVEPICRKYLELRYRLLPYTYSAVRETAE